MVRKLTPRQSRFCLEYHKIGVGAEAYRRSYSITDGNVAAVNACRLLSKPHIKRRLFQLEERLMKRNDITMDKVLTDYQYALDLAKKTNRADQIVAAAQAQAKLVGLLRDRVETGNVGDFPDNTTIEGILDAVSREAGPEAAMALASMFGLKVPVSQQTEQMKEAALFIADPASDSVN